MLAAALLTGLGLLCAPQDQTVRLQMATRDLLAPGQASVRVVADWWQNLQTRFVARWQGPQATASADADSPVLESRLREALAENARLREQLKQQRKIGPAGGQLQSTEPLFVPDLIEARVLGEESQPRLRTQAKKLLGAGEQNGVEILSLAVLSKSPQVDVGEDSHLQGDHLVLAGQIVAGRISQVGRCYRSPMRTTAGSPAWRVRQERVSNSVRKESSKETAARPVV